MNDLGGRLARGKGCTQDLVQAVVWYQKAADQGSSAALYNLGWCSEQAGKREEALDYYRRAKEAGDKAACWALGRYYERGTPAEQGKAFALYQEGADWQDLNCQCGLVRCYALGIGTQQDKAKAEFLARQVLDYPWTPSALEEYGSQEELAGVRKLLDQLTGKSS